MSTINALPIEVHAPGSVGAAMATQQLNAAATWLALSFTAQAKTLSAVRFYVSAVTGSGNHAVTVLLQADSSGQPSGSTLETISVTSTAVGWNTASGFTTALTGNARYWVIFINADAAPGTKFPTIQYSTSAPPPWLSPTATTPPWGWGRRVSTSSGTSWGTESSAIGYRIAYSDGSYDGLPLQSIAATTVTDGVYGVQRCGNRIVAPTGARLNVAGFAIALSAWTGTPTGNLVYSLYESSDPQLVRTATLPNGSPTTTIWQECFFSSPYALVPGQEYYFVILEDSNADSSSNRWNLRVFTWDSDAASLALLQLQVSQAYYDGTWHTVSGSFVPMVLLLDPTTPFVPYVSGRGLLSGGRI